MKIWMFIPAALLLGLLIGGWAPRADLRRAQNEIKELKQSVRDKPRGRGEVDGVIRMLGIEDKSGASRTTARRKARRGTPAGNYESPVALSDGTPNNAPGSVSNALQPEAATSATNPAVTAVPETDAAPLDMQARIDEAMELWKTRSDIARATLIGNSGLNAEQVAQFDVLVGAMNVRIGHALQNLADALKKEEQLTPETGVRVANEVTGAIVLGYQDMDRSMPAAWRTSAGQEFSLLDFVDPGVARPLVEVQDKLDDRPSVHGGRRQPPWRRNPPADSQGVTVEIK